MRASEIIVWAGGEHSFRLGIGELRAIEQRSNAGCSIVLARLLNSSWYIDDVFGPIRLGLIGGGMPQNEAQKMVDKVAADQSPYALAVTAADVLRRFIVWEDADQPGEPQAEAETP